VCVVIQTTTMKANIAYLEIWSLNVKLTMRVCGVCDREKRGREGVKGRYESGNHDAAVMEELIIRIESSARKWNYHEQENKNRPRA
jgi:hypothetical protein